MSGIYIHIPFCIQRCHYCDFYSTTKLKLRDRFVKACLHEMELRKEYLDNETADSIYFGGGTPSVMSYRGIATLLEGIYNNFRIADDCELTMEINPDDAGERALSEWKNLGFNRLSIGIQSFHNRDLQMMNRRHDAGQAVKAVEAAYAAGFENISVDLIYGLPDSGLEKWQYNLRMIQELPVTHLSAYHLTIESGTQFYYWMQEGKFREIEENQSYEQYLMLTKYAKRMGFQHYEISNFARNNQFSRHNMKYWTGEKYIGLGPSAHSYQIQARHWNSSSLQMYIDSYSNGRLNLSEEVIDPATRQNEFLMTRLRTKSGILKRDWIREMADGSWESLIKRAEKHLTSGNLVYTGGVLRIPNSKWFTADGVIADLFDL